MRTDTQRKVLLAIDGSDQSLDAAHYASKVLPSQHVEVVLFHVMRKIDDAFWTMGINPGICERVINIKAWEMEQDKAIKTFMDQSRQIFLDAGFSEEAVIVNIHESKVGVARDITEESKDGYSGIILGRRGHGKLKDLVFGSIAHKLIQRLTHVPVWVVGGKPEKGKLLLPLDTSEGAMKAVDHVGAMLGNSDVEVTLLHVIRGIDTFQSQYGYEFAYISSPSSELVKALEEEAVAMESTFDEAKKRLVDSGFDTKQVKTKVVTGARSRASGIIEEAQEGGHGTIVVGRRGMSTAGEFFMGSVSNKVLHLAKQMAVWVVS